MNSDANWIRLGRRVFLKQGTLLLAAASLSSTKLVGAEDVSDVRIGLVTDLHYADKEPAGTRYYRQSLEKLDTAVEQFQKADLTFAVELGDLIDSVDAVDVDLSYLKTIDGRFSTICQDRHYVLGNHCVETLKKEEFLGEVAQEKSYYSFDRGGTHFIVLDSCFRSDGIAYGRNNSHWTDANIPADELDWLKADLAAGDTPVIVFAHQRLDVSNNLGVKNNAAVREIFESSGRVRAVFQGHSHRNDLKEIGDIVYCTLVAMIEGSGAENNGYSVLEVKSDGTLILSGFGKQLSRNWSAAGAG